MIVKLTKSEVEIKENFTWGDKEKIQATLMRGANINGKGANPTEESVGFSFDTNAMLESKYTALECAVVSIKTGDKEEKWTRDWQDNLSVEDGDKLMESVDSLSKKK